MMEVPTPDTEGETRVVLALERIAVANEKLIELATEERDSGSTAFGPAFCPSCQAINPTVRNEGGHGPMGEFVLAAVCDSCGDRLYGIPQGWVVFKTPGEAKAYLEGRD